MKFSLDFILGGLAMAGCFGYLFLLTRSVVGYVKFKQKVYLLHTVCLKGIPFVVGAFLFTKNSSLMSLISLTLGISLGVCVFVGFVLKRGGV